MKTTREQSRETSADDLGEALADRRVARSLYFALRDVHIKQRFAVLREDGLTVD